MVSEDKISFKPPWYLINNHLETIYPALFRKSKSNHYVHKRILTNDNDFIDIDVYNIGSDQTVILSHGLEGNSKKPYMTGMISQLLKSGFNCVAWNFRGCSGSMNNHPYSYHSGATKDLDLIVRTTIQRFPGNRISLIGFSLGGNLVLKYLGEYDPDVLITRAVAISVPLDLYSSCLKISEPSNWLYTKRFLNTLKKKVKEKAVKFPDNFEVSGIEKISNLIEFDDRYTAPLHGFKDAQDYYKKCSALHFLKKIKVKTMIINAKNDPFLSKSCFPQRVDNHNLIFDYPEYGGHLGFTMSNGQQKYYHELKSLEFLLK